MITLKSWFFAKFVPCMFRHIFLNFISMEASITTMTLFNSVNVYVSRNIRSEQCSINTMVAIVTRDELCQ